MTGGPLAGDKGTVPVAGDVAEELSLAVHAYTRLVGVADRAGVPIAILLSTLEQTSASTPAGAEDPRAGLDPRSQRVLERAGLLTHDVPALGQRASTTTALRAAHLLAEAYTVKQAAALLDRNPSRIRQRIADRTLYGVQVHGEWRLPRFQFRDGAVVPGLDQVVRHLPEFLQPLAVENFLTRPSVDLDTGEGPVSPVDWLASGGDFATVAELAEQLHRLP